MGGSTDYKIYAHRNGERFLACLTWSQERAEKIIADGPRLYGADTTFTIEGPASDTKYASRDERTQTKESSEVTTP